MKKFLIFFIILPILLCEQIEIPQITNEIMKSSGQNKAKIYQVIREHSKKYAKNYPSGYEKLIKNLNGKIEFNVNQILPNELNVLKEKYGIPNELSGVLKTIKYVQKQVFDVIDFKIAAGIGKYFKIFGLAKRLEKNEIFFGYIKGEITGEIIPQKNSVEKKKCFKIGKWNIRCKKYYVDVPRPPSSNEIKNIAQALESKFFELVDKKTRT